MAKRKKKSPTADQRQALDAQQTSEVGWLHNDLQDHPVRGLTPQRLHQLLTAAETGDLTAQADLFSDMEERDGHIFSEIAKRKRAVLELDWLVKPPKNATPAEKKIAEQVHEWIDEIPELEQMFMDALDAVGHGYSALEIRWQRLGQLWLPESLEHVLPRFFQTPLESPNEIRFRDGSMNGSELWDFGWLLHRHKAKSGYVARTGLHRVLAWPFLFKNYSVRDLAEFLEIYGLPLRLGKYPTGATPEEKSTLLRAVMSIGHNAAGIIPQGMQIDFTEAAKGTADPHLAMMNWCEKTVSKVVLGSTLTSQADGASSTNALGKIHNEVRWELTKSDAKQLARSINDSLISYMLRLNMPNLDPRRYPVFAFDLTETEDITEFSEALPKLVDIGMQIPRQWAHERLGIPQPEDDQVAVLGRVVAPVPAVAVNSQAMLNQRISALAQGRQPLVEALTLEQQAAKDQLALEATLNEQLAPERLQAEAENLLPKLLTQLGQAGGVEQALEMLSQMQPDQDLEALQDDLAQLMFAAEVWGRLSDAGLTDV